MKLRSRKVILKKGGTIIPRHDPIHFSEEKEDFLKTNMIVGKVMKPVIQTNISQQSPSSILGGDIMDFSRIVKQIGRAHV